MTTIVPFTVLDVLAKAVAIVEAGELRTDQHHGAFCPWCAIASGKTALDEAHGIALPIGVALAAALSMAGGHRPRLDLPTDVPLTDAYDALRPWKDRFADEIDKDECLTILRTALAAVQKTGVH